MYSMILKIIIFENKENKFSKKKKDAKKFNCSLFKKKVSLQVNFTSKKLIHSFFQLIFFAVT